MIMKLTPKNKAYIDGLDYEQLLSHWRFAAVGDPWFEGETGKYWAERLGEMKEADPNRHVIASKSIGWTK